MPVIKMWDEEVELLTPLQFLQLHAIRQLRRLLPLYEQTRDPEIFAQIQHYDRYLPTEDDIPMENIWHRLQMYLLHELVLNLWRDRTDILVGGNNFIYYSLEQAEGIVRQKKDTYRGPDFFLITGVDLSKPREAWIAWEEDYKYPDLIVEFMSPSTEESDRETKRDIYRDVFRTREYFLYEPFENELIGYEWIDGVYVLKTPNERGWLWSNVLGVWFGQWQGVYRRHPFKWLRLYRSDGSLIPTDAEEKQVIRKQAAQERRLREQVQQQAEQERRLREQAEAELERLRAKLRELGADDTP